MRWLRLLVGVAVVAAWYVLLWPVAAVAWHHLLHQQMPWPADLARVALWCFWCFREFPGWRRAVGRADGVTTTDIVPEAPTAPLVGWRAWRISERMEWTDGSWVRNPTLVSWVIPDPWPEDRPKHAACYGGRHHDIAPAADCHCGIYAVINWQQAKLVSRIGRQQIYGLVLTWGRTQVHERGWRSEFAQPLALVRPRILRPKRQREMNILLNGVAVQYAVPVLSLNDAKALAKRMTEDQ